MPAERGTISRFIHWPRHRAEGIPGEKRRAEDLVNREIPFGAINRQLVLYTPESAQVSNVRFFDPDSANSQLNNLLGETAITFDAGGKKIAVDMVQVKKEGRLKRIKKIASQRSKNGEGYKKIIDDISVRTRRGRGFAIGFSIAGRMNGTRPDELTNLPVLQRELQGEPYNGDFANGSLMLSVWMVITTRLPELLQVPLKRQDPIKK
jgi:hypothetical protein